MAGLRLRDQVDGGKNGAGLKSEPRPDWPKKRKRSSETTGTYSERDGASDDQHDHGVHVSGLRRARTDRMTPYEHSSVVRMRGSKSRTDEADAVLEEVICSSTNNSPSSAPGTTTSGGSSSAGSGRLSASLRTLEEMGATKRKIRYESTTSCSSHRAKIGAQHRLRRLFTSNKTSSSTSSSSRPKMRPRRGRHRIDYPSWNKTSSSGSSSSSSRGVIATASAGGARLLYYGLFGLHQMKQLCNQVDPSVVDHVAGFGMQLLYNSGTAPVAVEAALLASGGRSSGRQLGASRRTGGREAVGRLERFLRKVQRSSPGRRKHHGSSSRSRARSSSSSEDSTSSTRTALGLGDSSSSLSSSGSGTSSSLRNEFLIERESRAHDMIRATTWTSGENSTSSQEQQEEQGRGLNQTNDATTSLSSSNSSGIPEEVKETQSVSDLHIDENENNVDAFVGRLTSDNNITDSMQNEEQAKSAGFRDFLDGTESERGEAKVFKSASTTRTTNSTDITDISTIRKTIGGAETEDHYEELQLPNQEVLLGGRCGTSNVKPTSEASSNKGDDISTTPISSTSGKSTAEGENYGTRTSEEGSAIPPEEDLAGAVAPRHPAGSGSGLLKENFRCFCKNGWPAITPEEGCIRQGAYACRECGEGFVFMPDSRYCAPYHSRRYPLSHDKPITGMLEIHTIMRGSISAKLLAKDRPWVKLARSLICRDMGIAPSLCFSREVKFPEPILEHYRGNAFTYQKERHSTAEKMFHRGKVLGWDEKGDKQVQGKRSGTEKDDDGTVGKPKDPSSGKQKQMLLESARQDVVARIQNLERQESTFPTEERDRRKVALLFLQLIMQDQSQRGGATTLAPPAAGKNVMFSAASILPAAQQAAVASGGTTGLTVNTKLWSEKTTLEDNDMLAAATPDGDSKANANSWYDSDYFRNPEKYENRDYVLYTGSAKAERALLNKPPGTNTWQWSSGAAVTGVSETALQTLAEFKVNSTVAKDLVDIANSIEANSTLYGGLKRNASNATSNASSNATFLFGSQEEEDQDHHLHLQEHKGEVQEVEGSSPINMMSSSTSQELSSSTLTSSSSGTTTTMEQVGEPVAKKKNNHVADDQEEELLMHRDEIETKNIQLQQEKPAAGQKQTRKAFKTEKQTVLLDYDTGEKQTTPGKLVDWGERSRNGLSFNLAAAGSTTSTSTSDADVLQTAQGQGRTGAAGVGDGPASPSVFGRFQADVQPGEVPGIERKLAEADHPRSTTPLSPEEQKRAAAQRMLDRENPPSEEELRRREAEKYWYPDRVGDTYHLTMPDASLSDYQRKVRRDVAYRRWGSLTMGSTKDLGLDLGPLPEKTPDNVPTRPPLVASSSSSSATTSTSSSSDDLAGGAPTTPRTPLEENAHSDPRGTSDGMSSSSMTRQGGGAAGALHLQVNFSRAPAEHSTEQDGTGHNMESLVSARSSIGAGDPSSSAALSTSSSSSSSSSGSSDEKTTIQDSSGGNVVVNSGEPNKGEYTLFAKENLLDEKSSYASVVPVVSFVSLKEQGLDASEAGVLFNHTHAYIDDFRVPEVVSRYTLSAYDNWHCPDSLSHRYVSLAIRDRKTCHKAADFFAPDGAEVEEMKNQWLPAGCHRTISNGHFVFNTQGSSWKEAAGELFGAGLLEKDSSSLGRRWSSDRGQKSSLPLPSSSIAATAESLTAGQKLIAGTLVGDHVEATPGAIASLAEQGRAHDGSSSEDGGSSRSTASGSSSGTISTTATQAEQRMLADSSSPKKGRGKVSHPTGKIHWTQDAEVKSLEDDDEQKEKEIELEAATHKARPATQLVCVLKRRVKLKKNKPVAAEVAAAQAPSNQPTSSALLEVAHVIDQAESSHEVGHSTMKNEDRRSQTKAAGAAGATSSEKETKLRDDHVSSEDDFDDDEDLMGDDDDFDGLDDLDLHEIEQRERQKAEAVTLAESSSSSTSQESEAGGATSATSGSSRRSTVVANHVRKYLPSASQDQFLYINPNAFNADSDCRDSVDFRDEGDLSCADWRAKSKDETCHDAYRTINENDFPFLFPDPGPSVDEEDEAPGDGSAEGSGSDEKSSPGDALTNAAAAGGNKTSAEKLPITEIDGIDDGVTEKETRIENSNTNTSFLFFQLPPADSVIIASSDKKSSGDHTSSSSGTASSSSSADGAAGAPVEDRFTSGIVGRLNVDHQKNKDAKTDAPLSRSDHFQQVYRNFMREKGELRGDRDFSHLHDSLSPAHQKREREELESAQSKLLSRKRMGRATSTSSSSSGQGGRGRDAPASLRNSMMRARKIPYSKFGIEQLLCNCPIACGIGPKGNCRREGCVKTCSVDSTPLMALKQPREYNKPSPGPAFDGPVHAIPGFCPVLNGLAAGRNCVHSYQCLSGRCCPFRKMCVPVSEASPEEESLAALADSATEAAGGGGEKAAQDAPPGPASPQEADATGLLTSGAHSLETPYKPSKRPLSSTSSVSSTSTKLLQIDGVDQVEQEKKAKSTIKALTSSSSAAAAGGPPPAGTSSKNNSKDKDEPKPLPAVVKAMNTDTLAIRLAARPRWLLPLVKSKYSTQDPVCGTPKLESEAEWRRNCDVPNDPSLSKCRCRMGFLLSYWSGHWTKQECAQEQLANGDRYSRQKITLPNATNTTAAPNEEKTEYDYEDLPEPGTLLAEAQQEPMSTSTSDAEGNHSSMSIGTSSKKEHQSSNKDIHFLDTMIDEQTLYSRGGPLPGPRRRSTLFSEFKRRRDGMDARRRRAALELAEKPEDKNRKTDEDANEESSKADETTKHMPLSYFPARHRNFCTFFNEHLGAIDLRLTMKMLLPQAFKADDAYTVIAIDTALRNALNEVPRVTGLVVPRFMKMMLMRVEATTPGKQHDVEDQDSVSEQDDPKEDAGKENEASASQSDEEEKEEAPQGVEKATIGDQHKNAVTSLSMLKSIFTPRRSSSASSLSSNGHNEQDHDDVVHANSLFRERRALLESLSTILGSNGPRRGGGKKNYPGAAPDATRLAAALLQMPASRSSQKDRPDHDVELRQHEHQTHHDGRAIRDRRALLSAALAVSNFLQLEAKSDRDFVVKTTEDLVRQMAMEQEKEDAQESEEVHAVRSSEDSEETTGRVATSSNVHQKALSLLQREKNIVDGILQMFAPSSRGAPPSQAQEDVAGTTKKMNEAGTSSDGSPRELLGGPSSSLVEQETRNTGSSSTTKSGQSISSSSTSSKKWITAAISSVTAAVAPAIAQTDVHSVITQAVETAHAQLPKYRSLQMPAKEDAKDVKEEAKETLKATEGSVGPAMTDAAKKKAEEVGLAPKVTFAHGATSTVRDEKDFLLVAKRVAVDVRMWIRLDDIPAMQHALGSEELRLAVQHQVGAMPSKDSGDKRVGDSVEPELPPLPAMLQARLDSRSAKFPSFAPCALPRLLSLQRPGVDCHPALADHFKDTLYQDWARLVASKERKRHAVAGGKWKAIWGKGPFEKGSRSTRNASGRVNGTRTPFDYTSAISGGEGLPQGLFDAYIGGANSSSISSTPTPSESSSSSSEDDDDVELLVLQHQGEKIDSRDQHQGNKSRNNKSKAFSKTKRSSTHSDENDLATWMGRKIVSFFGGEKLQTAPADNNNMDDPPGSEDAEAVADVFSSVKSSVEDRSGQEQEESESSTDETGLQKDESTVVSGNGTDALEASDNSTDVEEESFNVTNDTEGDAVEPVPMVNGVNVTEVRGTAGSASTPQATTTPVPFSMAEKTRKKRKKSRSTSSFAFERQQMKLHDLHGRRDVDDGSTTSTSSALPPTTGVPSSTAEGNRPHESLQDLIFENPQELYSVRNVDPTIRDRYSSNLAADSDTAPSSTSDKGGRGMAPNAISAEEPGGLVWWFLGSINRPVLTEIRIPFEVHYSDKFIADLKNKDQASTSGKNVADTWDMVTLMADVDVDFENKKPRNKASSSIATPTAEYMKTTSRSRRGPQAIVKQSKGSSQMKRAAPTSHLDLLELVESGTSTPEKEKPKTPRQGSAPVVEKTALSSGTHQRSVDKEDTEPTSSSGEESTKVVALAGNTKDVSEADKKKAIKAATTTSSSRPEQKSAQQLQQLQQGDEAKQGKSAAPPLALDSSAAGGGAAHDVVFTTGQAGFSLARVGNKLLAELSALNYASVVGEDTADDDETAERPGGRKANEDHFLWQRASVRIHEPAGFCPPHTIEYQPKAGAGEKKICADWVCRCPGSGMPAAGAKCPREGASVCEACPQGFAFADEERSGCVPIQPLLERYKGNIPWWNIAPEASSSSTGDDDLDHSFDVDIDDDDVDFDMTDANEVDSSSTSEKNEAGQVKAKHKSAHPFNTHAWEKPDRETETLMKQAAQENAKLWNPVPLELNLKVFDKRPLHIYGPEEMRRRAEQAEARACNATCEKCEEERQIKAVKVAKDRRAEFAVRERACDYYRNSYGDCCESCAVGGAVVNTVSCMSCVMGRDVGTPEVCYVIGSKDPKFADAPECVTIASSVELMQQSRQANEWAPDPRLSKASFSYANLTLQYRMWKPLSGVAKGVLIGLGGRSMLEADDELNFCGRHGEALNATLLSHSLDMIVICPIPRTYPLPGNTGIFEKTSCWEGFRKEAPGLCHSGGYAMTPANGHQPKPDNGPQDAEWLGEFLFELKSVYRGVPFFVLGYSGGSAVTYQLACSKYASAIAGIISVAYPFYDPFYGWQETEAPPDIDGVGRLDPMCKNVITSSSETHTPLLPGKNQVATLVDRTAGRTNIKAQNRRGAGDDSSTTSRSASSATSRTGPSTPTSTLRRTHSADTITNGANKRSTAELQGEAVIRKEDQEAITGGAAANTAGHGVTSGFYFEDDMRGVLEEETTAEDLKFRRSTSEQENRQVAVAPEIVDGAQLYADAEPIQIVKPPRHFVLYGSFDTAMNLMNVAVPRFGHYSTHSSMLCDASQFHAASPVFEMEKAAALNEYDQTHLVCSDFVNATSPMFEELKATAKMKSTISGVEHHVDPDLVFADAAPVTAVEKSYQLLEEQRKARSLQGELVTDIEHNDEPTSSIQTSSSSTSRENVVALLQLDGMRVAASNAEHATKTTRRTSAGSSLTRTGGTSGGSARTSSTSSSSSISGKGDSSKITCPSRICRFGSAPDYATQHQPALATKAAFRGIDYFVNTLRLFGGTFALSAEEFKDLDMSHIERQATAR